MNQQLTVFDAFNTELATREEELAAILPPHISREKFVKTAIIAVKNSPGLLKADRRSLHQAITEAAEDGLHPDGREGAIVLYGQEAQWNPMMFGIRKRAMELATVVIDAQVVHANDHFVWHQGDEPRIEHTPAPLGQDRGAMIGAYAIIKKGSEILHREVMDKTQIETARNQSRTWQKSLMWSKFVSEAWRKTVLRRAIKTVPSVPALEKIITREDRNYDFAGGIPQAAELSSIPSAPRQAETIELIAEAEPAPEAASEAIAQEAPPEVKKGPQASKSGAKGQTPDAGKAAFLKALAAAETKSALNGVWDIFGKKFKAADLEWATEQFELRFNQMSGG